MSDHTCCLGIRVCGDKISCPLQQLNGGCIEEQCPGQQPTLTLTAHSHGSSTKRITKRGLGPQALVSYKQSNTPNATFSVLGLHHTHAVHRRMRRFPTHHTQCGPSVCLLATWMSAAKTAEPIETYFGEHTPWVVHCHVMSVSTCGRDKGGGGWVQAASWCPDIPPPRSWFQKKSLQFRHQRPWHQQSILLQRAEVKSVQRK